MNNTNSNDKSNTTQANTPAGKDSVPQGKDARPATGAGDPSPQTAGKDATKGTESPTKS